jgi:glycosyltransferase involved in cell wall biosynthesis
MTQMPSTSSSPRIFNNLGVVAIGRNEGNRLRRCLESIGGRAPVVYVDSGSTDGSVVLARSMGIEVVELDGSIPFSAARARNAGFERLRELVPGLRYVQFVDGDCEIVADWLDRAEVTLADQPGVAVVCGRRRERYPETSIYNRLADIEWDTPIGEADSCGGDALMRVEAFEAVGGFDPSVPAGEEPELCRRLRLDGWIVLRIDAEMTRHDIATTRFRQWWRRQFRSGYNGLDVITRFAKEPGGPFRRQVRSARFWTLGWLGALFTSGVAGALLSRPAVGAAIAGIVALTLPVQALRIAARIRPKAGSIRSAMAYSALTIIGKWGELAGQLAYLRDRTLGRNARLIEYKHVAPVRPNSMATEQSGAT